VASEAAGKLPEPRAAREASRPGAVPPTIRRQPPCAGASATAAASLPRGVSVLVALSVASLGVVPAAHADARPLGDVLVVSGSDGCIDRDGLVEAVAAWLGTDRVQPRLSVLVQVSEPSRPGRPLVVVLLEDGAPRATRAFDRLPRACSDRRAIVSLAIALAMDANLLSRTAPSEVRGESFRPGAEAEETRAGGSNRPAPAPRVPPAAAPRPDDGLRLALGLEVAAGFGLLSAPIALVAADVVSFLGRRASLVLGGVASSTASSTLGAGVAMARLVGGRGFACLSRPSGTVSATLCGGALVAAVIAEGRGYDHDRRDVAPLVDGLARAQIGVRLGAGVEVHVAVDGALGLVRPRFVVQAGGHRTAAASSVPPVGLALSAGLRLVP
jgi:hypothetical protein